MPGPSMSIRLRSPSPARSKSKEKGEQDQDQSHRKRAAGEHTGELIGVLHRDMVFRHEKYDNARHDEHENERRDLQPPDQPVVVFLLRQASHVPSLSIILIRDEKINRILWKKANPDSAELNQDLQAADTRQQAPVRSILRLFFIRIPA